MTYGRSPVLPGLDYEKQDNMLLFVCSAANESKQGFC